MLYSPAKHHIYYREQGLTEFSNSIFGTWRKLREYSLCYQSIFYKLFQLNIKNSGSSLRETLVDFARTHGFA